MTFRRMTLPLILILAVFLLCSCGGKKEEPAPEKMSEAQRDSIIGESDLPGASTVKSALALSDSAQARADRANAAGNH